MEEGIGRVGAMIDVCYPFGQGWPEWELEAFVNAEIKSGCAK